MDHDSAVPATSGAPNPLGGRSAAGTTGSTVLPVVGIAAGAVAGVMLGTARWLGALPSVDWDPLTVLLSLLGIVLLAWAVILTGWQAVMLCRRWLAGDPTGRREAVLTSAAVVVLVVVTLAFPLWGSGGASG